MKAISLFFLATLLACGAPPQVERDPEPLMQTSDLRYQVTKNRIGFAATIPYTYRNATGGTVYLANCDGDIRPMLQKQRNGKWFDAWEPFRIHCESPPVVIRPGATFSDTLDLMGAPPGSNVMPAFVFPEIEGVYRLVWFQALSSPPDSSGGSGSRLDERYRVSNPFVLER